MSNYVKTKSQKNAFSFIPNGNKFSYRRDSDDNYDSSVHVGVVIDSYNSITANSSEDDEAWSYDQWINYIRKLLFSLNNKIVEKESEGYKLNSIYFEDPDCCNLAVTFVDEEQHLDKTIITYDSLYNN